MSDLHDRLNTALAGRYHIERELGEGGMATVYLARDLRHNRNVALKVLKPDLTHALAQERFLREIEIAANLAHPNILPLHDSGTAAGLLYFVMPYVEGESLRQRLDREGGLPLDEAIRVASEVGEALTYAHSRGLVHRDVKPENILFQAGHAVLSDFGIARALSEAAGSKLTQAGLALGTLEYMSPEQATGQTELDGRTDVYGLGCVLFEMLTGATPYGGATPHAVLAQKLMDSAPDVTVIRPEVPGTISTVVAKALAADPVDRFEEAADFTRALAHAVTTQAIEEDTHRARRARSRRWVLAAVGIAAVASSGWWLSTWVGGPAYRRLAVLPITNPTGDPGQDFLTRGVHDALISELGIAGVTVIGRQSVLKYQDTDTRLGDIAQELGVDAVVEGSALRVGDSVAIQVRLIDGDTEEQLWTGSYAEEMHNVMAIYRGVTRAIADEIQLALAPDAEARLRDFPEVDPEVYAALLQGEFHWAQLTPDGLETALRYFELALQRDPDNAVAYAGVARVWGARAQMGLVSSVEAEPYVRAALARSLEADSTLSEVYFALASTTMWWEWNWEGMDRAFSRAVALDPTRARTLAYYAHYLFLRGRRDEAISTMERARELDPFDSLIGAIHGMGLIYAHRFEEAVEYLEETLQSSPNDPVARSTLRTAYHMTGQHEEALEIWRQSYAASGNTEALAALERGWDSGGYAGALGAAAQALELQSHATFVTPWQIATLYTRAGNVGKALEFLQQALDARDPNFPYIAVDPIFDFMREDPRFVDLLRRINLAP